MKTAALLLAIALPLAPGKVQAEVIERGGDMIAGAAIGIGTNVLFTHAREHASLGFAWERNRAGPVVTIAW